MQERLNQMQNNKSDTEFIRLYFYYIYYFTNNELQPRAHTNKLVDASLDT